ncbi:RiPP maturation radical SAM C-methyltransferase [bacterium]|nr:RiPP maturation radical SAM C-methyltransferase [bacterium]
MFDIVLVQMPYVAVQRPSIALSVLKAALALEKVTCQVVYPNLWWAEEIGLGLYEAVASTQNDDLLGDWIFAGAAFPGHQPDSLAYFELLNLDVTQVMFGARADILEKFQACRDKATDFVERTAQRILALSPKIVGCTSMFAQNCASLALLRRIRELAPEVTTMMGGANCDTPMGEVLHSNFSWVDYLMGGEADLTFGPFCRALLDGRCELPKGMLGPQHRIRPEPVQRAITFKLDEVPTPDFDDYFRTLNASPLGAYVQPGLVVESSRGCWWGETHHCTFCGLNANGMTFRSRSAEAAQREFAAVADRYGVEQFLVADNIIDTRHFKTLLPLLGQDPHNYTLFYETKSNLKRDQIDLLLNAGVIWVQPGFESLHDDILKLIDKGTTAAVNVQTLKWSREKGLRLSWNILSGFPNEKDEWYSEMAEWVPSIIHLQPPQGVVKFRYDRYSPYQLRPQDYGVKLLPNRRYAFVYPLDPAGLEKLAYFFEDERDVSGLMSVPEQVIDKKDTLQARTQRDYQEYYRYLMATATRRGQRGREGPGRALLTDLVEEWIRIFWQDLPPICSVSDMEGSLRFFDTRPVAVSRQWQCDGLARRLYQACDTARTPVRLAQDLECSWEDLEPLVREMHARRLLLPLSGRWLAVAVEGEIPPMPTAHVFPGGYLAPKPRPDHPHDAPWSIRGLPAQGESLLSR